VKVGGKHYRTVWVQGGKVKLIDQNLLPHEFSIATSASSMQTAAAIKDMTVRGAPAIGAAAGYAMAQAIGEAKGNWRAAKASRKLIESTRPTAVELFHATARVWQAAREDSGRARVRSAAQEASEQARAAWEEASAIADESAAACRAIGEIGAGELFSHGNNILTHCNAGWLACVDWGTALSPIYFYNRSGGRPFVYSSETRPRGQGARLTAWELGHEAVNHRIISDGMSASLMASGAIDAVIVGADRIAANGDTANKIGTYSHAIAALHHGIPFYVAAPTSTIDFSTPRGGRIPIEQRSEDEVHWVKGADEKGVIRRVRWTAPGSRAINPAFDVTPAQLITAVITEKGIFKPGELWRVV